SDAFDPGQLAELVKNSRSSQVAPPPWSLVHRRDPPFVARACGFATHDLDLAEHAAGWPLLAVVGRAAESPTSASPVPVRGEDASVTLWKHSAGSGGVTLAFLPVWKGFVLDSALYDSVWTVVLLGLLHLIRHVRIRTGLCPVCRYDLAGL